MLPGVGAFGACARALHESGLEDPARARHRGRRAVLRRVRRLPAALRGLGREPRRGGSRRLPRHGGAAARRREAPADAVEHAAGARHGGAEPAPLRGLGAAALGLLRALLRAAGRATRRRRCATTAARWRRWPPVARCGARSSTRRSPGPPGWRCWPTSCAARRGGGLMDLLPAIDLRGGTAVRLTQGDFAREDRYGDPVALAASYIAGGARWIHVVDLDGARTGVPHERAVLGGIVRLATEAGVERGVRRRHPLRGRRRGGLDSGVARVVLGTAALEEPALAGRCARRWPGRVAVGLDYRVGDGRGGRGAGAGMAGRIGPVRRPTCSSCGSTSPSAPSWPPRWRATACCRAPTWPACRRCWRPRRCRSWRRAASRAWRTSSRWPGSKAAGRRLAGAIVGKAIVEGRFSVEEGIAACAASD